MLLRIRPLLVLAVLLLAACTGGLPRQEPTALPMPTAEPSPTVMEEPAATATTASATAAPSPAATLAATPLPLTGGCPATPADPNLTQAVVPGPINGQPESTAEGERLVIVGTVYDQNCQPAPGVAFNIWHTDPAGVYGPRSGSNSEMNCCYYGATVTTDAQGRYALRTLRPAPYAGEVNSPPAHIHVELAEAHPAGPLHAEIVFTGDPLLTNPAAYTNPPPITLTAATDDQGEFWLGVADLRLQGALPADQPAAPAAETPTANPPAAARTFTIVSGESTATYQIREKFADIAEMVSPVGVTGGVEGEIRLALGEPPALEAMTVRVDLTRLNTGEPNRDEKNYDRWLVTRDFPHATFTATEIKDGPASYREGEEVSFTLTGDLTIRDVTRPVDFAVTARVEGGTLTGQAEGQILLTDFGIDPPDLLGFVKVENDVVIRVDLKAVEE